MEGSDVAVRAKKHKKRKGKKQKHRSERCVRTCAPFVDVTFFLSCCTCTVVRGSYRILLNFAVEQKRFQ